MRYNMAAMYHPAQQLALRTWRGLSRAYRVRPSLGRAALVMALALVLGEPLLCVVHCQLLAPAAGHVRRAPALPATLRPEDAHAALAVAGASCGVRQETPAGSAAYVPPSPVREAAPVAALLLLASLLAGALVPAHVTSQLPPNPLPPFRPPSALA